MKTYIFKHSLLGVILGLSILGCTCLLYTSDAADD